MLDGTFGTLVFYDVFDKIWYLPIKNFKIATRNSKMAANFITQKFLIQEWTIFLYMLNHDKNKIELITFACQISNYFLPDHLKIQDRCQFCYTEIYNSILRTFIYMFITKIVQMNNLHIEFVEPTMDSQFNWIWKSYFIVDVFSVNKPKILL